MCIRTAMSLVLVLGFFVVISTAHNITLLQVPRYGDPRGDVTLACRYEKERLDPPIHSVKWYHDSNEVFRFTPGQQPQFRTFNTSLGRVTMDACNMHVCSIKVMLPMRYNTQMSYTCEVSTEGPRFAFVRETKNLTVAVVLKESPTISGLPSSAQPGEELLLNCTTPPAMPPANIVWLVDGKPERLTESWLIDKTEVSSPDEHGLRSSWRALRLRVTSQPVSQLDVECRATQPTAPPHQRSATGTVLVARTPHLSMFTAYGTSPPLHNSSNIVISIAICALYMWSQNSASRYPI